ncbi:MAG: ABC transporter ATP-binding protein [Candidatus Omnitrophota bacterium]
MLLNVSSVTKQYVSGTQKVAAIDNVSLSLQKGDYLSIAGPSGSGKSTLLHMMGGLDVPTKGVIHYNGIDIFSLSDKNLSVWRAGKVGFIFQFYHLIEELNVLENITVAAFSSKGKLSLKRARSLLEYLGIAQREIFFPSQLSGGQKQKVAIARALINDPDIILCDEPTGSLDKDSGQNVADLLEQMNKEMKKTIILVTHNIEIAQRANKVLYLREGKLVSKNT